MLAGVTSSWARPILSLVASWAASLQRTRRWTRSWRITKTWSWQCLCPRPWSRASWASPQEKRETKKLKKENVSRSQWKLTHEGIFTILLVIISHVEMQKFHVECSWVSSLDIFPILFALLWIFNYHFKGTLTNWGEVFPHPELNLNSKFGLQDPWDATSVPETKWEKSNSATETTKCVWERMKCGLKIIRFLLRDLLCPLHLLELKDQGRNQSTSILFVKRLGSILTWTWTDPISSQREDHLVPILIWEVAFRELVRVQETPNPYTGGFPLRVIPSWTKKDRCPQRMTLTCRIRSRDTMIIHNFEFNFSVPQNIRIFLN